MQRTTGSDGSTRLAVAFGLVALAVLGLAAYLLANGQANQRADQRDRYADRAKIATGLVDSLFGVAYNGQAQDASRRFPDGRATTAQLDAAARRNSVLFTLIVDQRRRIVAASSGTPPQASARAGASRSLGRALQQGFGISDVRPGRIPYVVSNVAFRTRRGQMVLVQATPVKAFATFLDGTLARLPQASGGAAYVLDGNGVVLGRAGAAARRPSGAISRESATRALGVSKGVFFAADPMPHTNWRTVVTAPEASLYESLGGVSRWIPWLLLAFGALSIVALAVLLRRLTRTATLLRGANEQLGHSNAELARSNADLEQFAYAASHDLSEPLRTVAGFSQLLRRRYRGHIDAEADLYIDHMGQGVDRMQQLIDDLLLYSRVGRQPIGNEPIDLDGVLDDVLSAIAPTIAERDALITHDELPSVRGERSQLAQVLQNLLLNALKFTAPGVRPEIHVAARREGRGWRISVRDNGIGVAEEQREAIFKMFGRLHPADEYPGTGIGLALVQRIVERHGGRVWVEPVADGPGSVFSFTLPDRAGAPAVRRERVLA